MEIKNKVAIVTGASSGIGEATAEALVANGAKVVLAARSMDKLNALKEKLNQAGGEVLVVKLDVTKKEDFKNLVEKTLENFDTIDILVNNAGIMPLSFVKSLKTDEWEQMIDTNIKGVLNGVGAVLPTLLENKSGHIINISSVAGRKVFQGGAVYCATKFAVTAFSEGLRAELSPSENIRITAIEPGAVNTNLTSTITDEKVKEQMMPMYENMEMLEATDIAASVIYALKQPQRVNVNEVLLLPTEQNM